MSTPEQNELIAHRNLAVLETADGPALDALFARPELRSCLWMRLDDRRALIDPESIETLVQHLESAGIPPHFAVDLSA